MKKLLFVILMLLAVTFTFAACFGGGGDSEDSSDVIEDTPTHQCTPGRTETVEEVASSCEYEGVAVTYTYCAECDNIIDSVRAPIEKKPHTPGDTQTFSAQVDPCSDTRTFFDETRCGKCNALISRVERTEPKTPYHTTTEVRFENVKEPTCISEGSRDEITFCVKCETVISTKTVILEKTDHVHAADVFENVIKPTCTEDGSHDVVIYCANEECGVEILRTNLPLRKTGHTPADAVKENEVKPSCTVTGSYDEVVYCGTCNEELSRRTVTVPVAHQLDEWGICILCDPDATRGLEYSESSGAASVIGRGTFKGNKLVIPSMYNGKRVTSINTNGFSNDTSLYSVTIGKEIKSINSGAFVGCSRLIEVVDYSGRLGLTAGSTSHGRVAVNAIEVHSEEKSKLSYYGDFIFYTYNEVNYLVGYIGEATSLELPEKYFNQKYEINKYAFSGHSAITDVIIPNSVTKIGDFAFAGCIALLRLSIPYDVEAFNANAFQGCFVEELTVPAPYASLLQRSNLKKINITRGPSNVDTVAASAFKDCTSLVEVTVGHGVHVIDDYAFSGCTSLVSVSLSETVLKIGTGAFEGCYRLAEVINNSTLTITAGSEEQGMIAKHAIEVHNLKSKIADVDGYIFYISDTANYLLLYTGRKTELTLPENYEGESYAVHSYAFKDCQRITSITALGSITSVGDCAFSGCSNLGYLTLSRNIISLGNGIFNECSALKTISVEGSNTVYKSINGNLYSKDGKTLIKYAVGRSAAEFAVPEGVETISSEAFLGCVSLQSVTVPRSVAAINDSAFYGCTSLTKVIFEENSALSSVGDNVFYGSKITEAAIPAVLISKMPLNNVVILTVNGGAAIGDSALSGLTSLKSLTVGNSITSIGANAFSGCTSLTEVTVGEGVVSIGESAFSECASLSDVYISDVSKWCSIAFANANSNPLSHKGNLYLDGSLVKELVIPSDVKTVSQYAFYSCNSINKVIFSNGVQTVDTSALEGCAFLASVQLPESMRSINYRAFADCYRLAEVINLSQYITPSVGKDIYGCVAYYATAIHSGESRIQNIDNYLFYVDYYNVYLVAYIGETSTSTELTLPEQVGGNSYHIRKYAFYNFGQMNSIVIPADVKSVGERAFEGCRFESAAIPTTVFSGFPLGYLKHITVNGGEAIENDRFEGCTLLETAVIGDSVKSVGSDAFLGCTALKSVAIGSGVTEIPVSMFYNCSSLTDVTIGKNVTKIGTSSFLGCASLKNVVIPAGVTVILQNAFNSCTSLESVEFEGPVNKLNVIYDYAFYKCESLVSIKIPSSVNQIWPYAFACCYSLESVTFDGCSPHIQKNAFDDCSKIASVNISSIDKWCCTSFENANANPLSSAKKLYLNGELVTDVVMPSGMEKVPQYLFYNCDSLKSVTLPEGFTDVGAYAFYKCEGLEDINLPKTLIYINGYAFDGCSSLEAIDVPSSVNTIGQYAFASCTSLKELSVPTGVKYIENSAFFGCRSLYRVSLGDSISSVGEWAFRGCYNLMSVEIGKSFGPIYDEAFLSCHSLVEIINHSQRTFTIGSSYDGGIAKNALEIHTGESKLVNKDGYLFYTYEGKNLLLGYVGDSTELVLPENYNGENYVIHRYAFSDNYKITSVVISGGVTEIGASAFDGCYNIKSVVIGENVTQIAPSAFYDCDGLESVEFKSAEGWTVNGTEIAGLSDAATAAEYLKSRYLYNVWQKSE